MKREYEVLDLHRVYVTDSGGMGWDQGTIGHYTDLAGAEHAASLSKHAPYVAIRKVHAIRVGGEYFELKDPIAIEVNVPVEKHEANAARKKALSKLTESEKIALGVK